MGGQATVFRGVLVKIKCPTRKFDRSLITWWYNGKNIDPNDESFKGRITNKGVLKIPRIQSTDAGVYVCKGKLTKYLILYIFFVKKICFLNKVLLSKIPMSS